MGTLETGKIKQAGEKCYLEAVKKIEIKRDKFRVCCVVKMT